MVIMTFTGIKEDSVYEIPSQSPFFRKTSTFTLTRFLDHLVYEDFIFWNYLIIIKIILFSTNLTICNQILLW